MVSLLQSHLPLVGVPYSPEKGPRQRLALENNESPSTVPPLFFDPLPPGKAEREGACTESISVLFFRILPTLRFKDDEALMYALKSNIQDHLELRIQLFASMLLMVYNTGIQFSYSNSAKAQAGVEKKEGLPIQLAEAHASTFPCLLFEIEGRNYILGGGGSSFYHAQNTTGKLPTACNKVDTWIDTNKASCGGVSLREKAFTFVQRTAGDNPDPTKALINFIDELIRRISIFENPKTIKNSQEKLAARFYAEVAAAYKIQMHDRPREFMKALFHERNSKDPMDTGFYLRLQKRLHEQLINESNRNIQERQLVIPTSPQKKIYERIWHVDASLEPLLSKYFSETAEAVLREDWKNVQLATPAKTHKLSLPLRLIFQEINTAVKTTYGLKGNPRGVGSIVQRTLYDSSLTLNPGLAELYKKWTETRKSGRLARKA